MQTTLFAAALLLAGCTTMPQTKEDSPLVLGGPVAEARAAPAEYLPITKLDFPPRTIPRQERLPPHTDSRIIKEVGEQAVSTILLIDEEGRVTDVIIRKANYEYFAEQARRRCRTIRFQSATSEGRSTKWFAEVPVIFSNE